MFRELQSRVGNAWCALAHESALWPIHGHYSCRTCGRRYPAFEEPRVEHGAIEAASSRLSPLPARVPESSAGLTRA